MSELDSIAKQRIRKAAVLSFVAMVTSNATDPERIGKRVIIAEHALNEGSEFAEKSKVLADRLGVSEARVSIALSAIRKSIDELIKC